MLRSRGTVKKKFFGRVKNMIGNEDFQQRFSSNL